MATTEHRPRRDKGLILASPRDIRVLTVVAHHGIARHDHLWEMLAREPGGPTRQAGDLAETTVRDAISRWQRAGWMTYNRVLASERGYGYITKKGLRLVGLDDVYEGRPPAELRYHHYWAVLDVRLHWWDENGEKNEPQEWIPERRLRVEATNVNEKKHPDHVSASIRMTGDDIIPDAVVVGDGWTDAIEVQLSPLKPKEMQSKLERLVRATYFHVEHEKEYIYNEIHFYVPSPAMQRHIERAREHLDQAGQERITINLEPRYERFTPLER